MAAPGGYETGVPRAVQHVRPHAALRAAPGARAAGGGAAAGAARAGGAAGGAAADGVRHGGLAAAPGLQPPHRRALHVLRGRRAAAGTSRSHSLSVRGGDGEGSGNVSVRPQEEVFPSAGVARLLLACGAGVARRNRARCTPLHLAAIPYNFTTDVSNLFLYFLIL